MESTIPMARTGSAKFQDGIRFLRDRAAKSGARVLHLTPPVFDPVPIRSHTLPEGLAEYRQPYECYDDVLERYSHGCWPSGRTAGTLWIFISR